MDYVARFEDALTPAEETLSPRIRIVSSFESGLMIRIMDELAVPRFRGITPSTTPGAVNQLQRLLTHVVASSIRALVRSEIVISLFGPSTNSLLNARAIAARVC